MIKSKLILGILCLFVMQFSYGQAYNVSKGVVAEGYDVVAYFSQKAVKGSNKFQAEYQGAKFNFSNAENQAKFKENPDKYLPQYGAFCAYAMAKTGDKVEVDPKTFEIRDGKLYLFYNAFFTNTLDKWLDEGPAKLIPNADTNWTKL